MNKYIDADELKTILEVRIATGLDGYGGNLKWLLENIDSLQQEQPSLPGNLDEAAEEWCKTNNKGIALTADKKSHYLAEGKDAFKAGAEWMSKQGVNK